MDEPTANLDAHSVALMAALAQDLREHGSGLVVISHQHNALTDLWSGNGPSPVASCKRRPL